MSKKYKCSSCGKIQKRKPRKILGPHPTIRNELYFILPLCRKCAGNPVGLRVVHGVKIQISDVTYRILEDEIHSCLFQPEFPNARTDVILARNLKYWGQLGRQVSNEEI